MRTENGRLVLTPIQDPPSFTLEDLLAGITEENLHTEIETGPAVGNEFA
jgi:antitoxin MazE